MQSYLSDSLDSFGIITPVLSVTISVFMLGLAIGSWIGGRYIDRWTQKTKLSPILFYAGAELFIASGAFIVPKLFSLSQQLLLGTGESNSLWYLVLSAPLIMTSMLPWCMAMGTTFPFMMSFIKKTNPSERDSFSFLYTANVLGAVSGILLTTIVLIENFGFRQALWFAGCLNICAALLAYRIARETGDNPAFPEKSAETLLTQTPSNSLMPVPQLILFVTGFTSLAMEVAWTRAFTPVLGTMVYAFSFLLAGYLLATWLGSSLYRLDAAAGKVRSGTLLIMLLAVFAFLPVVVNDPQLVNHFRGHFGMYSYLFLVLLTIFPLCTTLGYFMPSLIDRYSRGDPYKAGKSYAFNILGCILGPVVTSYLLLPSLGVKFTLIAMALPYVFFFWVFIRRLSWPVRLFGGAASLALFLVSLFWSTSYEIPRLQNLVVKRDYTATVVCATVQERKLLLVNGIGITSLTPITKFMAHLPLSFHAGKPESALAICFGMGTTYRSLLSWGVKTDAVELVPSVRDVFSYFFADAESLISNPRGRIIIDDGRRFLMLAKEKYDVITIDPPPR